jgi:hypothetical protein
MGALQLVTALLRQLLKSRPAASRWSDGATWL